MNKFNWLVGVGILTFFSEKTVAQKAPFPGAKDHQKGAQQVSRDYMKSKQDSLSHTLLKPGSSVHISQGERSALDSLKKRIDDKNRRLDRQTKGSGATIYRRKRI